MLFRNFIELSIAIIILIAVAIILFFLNKKTKEEITDERKKITRYKRDFDKIKNSKNVIKQLNELAKDFFEEKYKIKKNHSYLESAKLFRKKNKLEHVEFCNLMSETMYSGKKLDKARTQKIINLFSNILKNPYLD